MLPGTNTLLCGGTGTGKTASLRTIAASGIELFVLATEQQTIRGLTDDRFVKAPAELIHYRYVPATQGNWAGLMEQATMVHTKGPEEIAKGRAFGKKDNLQWFDVINTCIDFVDQHGESFGNVDGWDTDRAFAIDGLSGLSDMVRKHAVGLKPNPAPGDWNNMQQTLGDFLNMCCQIRCHFALVSHLEKEVDELSGGLKKMPSAPGRKLAPTLPRLFDDVVMAKREGGKFFWSTDEAMTDLKPTWLPIGSKLAPNFEQILKAWRAANERI